MMRNNRARFESLGVLVAILVGACSSEDPAQPISFDNSSTTAATGVGGATSGAGTPTSTNTATIGGVGDTSAVTGTTTGGGVVTTAGGASSTGIAGTTTVGVAGSGTVGSTTAGMGGAGVGGSTSTMGGMGGTTVSCNMISGEEFFKKPTECALCHGEDALGVPVGVNNLGAGPEVRHPDPDYARWIVRTGRDDHPDFPDGMDPYDDECILNDQMLEEIIVFLNSFPQPTTGEELYLDYCANCHGADGRGGVTTRDLNGELHETAGLMNTGAHTMEYENRPEYMPALSSQLTQAEVDLIMQYLQNDLGLGF